MTQIEDNGHLPPDKLDPSEVREYRTLKKEMKVLLERIIFTQKLWSLIRRTLVWLAWAIGGLWAIKDMIPWMIDTILRVFKVVAGPQ